MHAGWGGKEWGGVVTEDADVGCAAELVADVHQGLGQSHPQSPQCERPRQVFLLHPEFRLLPPEGTPHQLAGRPLSRVSLKVPLTNQTASYNAAWLITLICQPKMKKRRSRARWLSRQG